MNWAIEMSSKKLKLGLDEITDDKIKTNKFRYCQNKLCGVRNTTIRGRYCSMMCAAYDAGVISGKKWVEMHFKFWVNSKVPKIQLGI